MKTQAVRIIKFDAGHRVVNHESKCRTLHGHEYKAEIFAEADTLDSLGRIIDFSIIKQYIGSWIDNNWDHNLIIFKDDPDIELIKQISGAKSAFITDFNPTAENIAKHMVENIAPDILKGTGCVLIKCSVEETRKCSAAYEIESI